MKEILKSVTSKMAAAGIDFCIGRKKGKPSYPYFIGQLYQLAAPDESGKTEYEMLIDGFCREDEFKLIEATERIESLFDPVEGYIMELDSGVAVFFFDSVIPDIPTGEDVDLNRNQSKIKIRYWKGKVTDENGSY